MQEKKNKILVASLGFLLITTVACYFVITKQESTPVVEKDLFTSENLDEVDSITLVSARDTVKLGFNGSRWSVNHYPADRNMIDVLFATLKESQPFRPVASTLQDSLYNYLKSEGVRVTLFRDGTVDKSFIAGGNEIKTQAWFTTPDGDVYVMIIPGYRVYVSGIFELGVNGFRDKYAFAFNWRNFKSLTTEFPHDPKAGFSVTMERNMAVVPGLTSVDTAKLNTFLDEISLLRVETYAPDITDSLTQQEPSMSISVEDIASRAYRLVLFESQRKGLVPGLLNGEGVYFRPHEIRPVIRKKSFFSK